MKTLQDEIQGIKDEMAADADKYLTFSIGKDKYAMDIKYIEDIIGVQNIASVPEQPDYLKGVINLRGIIIPVIDIRIRFNKEERAYDDRTCIVVINMDDAAVGIVVDTVLEVMSIEVDAIAQPPAFNESVANQYMKGIGRHKDDVIIIVDCYALITES